MRGRASIVLCLLVGCPSDEEREAQQDAVDKLERYESRLEEIETQLEHAQRQLEVAEPPAPGAEADRATIAELARDAVVGSDVKSTVTVTLSADGMRLDGKPVSRAQLQEGLTAAGRLEDPSLILRAEADVPHARVVEVLDAAKTAGIQRMSIATMNEDPGPELSSGPTGRSDRRENRTRD